MYTNPIDYQLDEQVQAAYRESLYDHIRFVREAGQQLGVPDRLLAIHDQSKFSEDEFVGYATHFHGGGAPDLFATAWLHHIHHNPHHWQHWIFPDGFTPPDSSIENGVARMPLYYALEMIADWMGASMAYTASWDMQDWLHNNMPRITLHSETAMYVREVLDMLGYADVIYTQKFKHEQEKQV